MAGTTLMQTLNSISHKRIIQLHSHRRTHLQNNFWSDITLVFTGEVLSSSAVSLGTQAVQSCCIHRRRAESDNWRSGRRSLFLLKEMHILIVHDSSTESARRAQRFPEVRLSSSIRHTWTPYLWSVHEQQLLLHPVCSQ